MSGSFRAALRCLWTPRITVLARPARWSKRDGAGSRRCAALPILSNMRISPEQAAATARFLHKKGSDVKAVLGASAPLSEEFLVRVVSVIKASPEVRPERVCAGRQLLSGELPSSEEVAERILWRAMADSLH